jgi:hypothetical protein
MLVLSLHTLPEAPPAALQWSLEYPSDANLSIDDGPAVVAAQKTVLCVRNARGCTCLATGFNTNPISDGIVAIVALIPSPGGSAATTVQLTNLQGASPAGDPIPLDASNLATTVIVRPSLLVTQRPSARRGTAGK